MKQTTKEIFKLINTFLDKFDNIGLIRDNLTEEEVNSIYNILDKYQYKNDGFLKQNMILVDLRCWVGMISILLNEVRGEFNGLVYAIDDFNRAGRFDTRYLNIQNICEDNIRNIGAWDTIKLIIQDPVEYSKRFEDNTIDVLFFNNIVSYEEIRKILKNWYPKVKNGGLIIGRYCETLDLDGLDNFRGDEKIPFNLHLGIIKAIKEKLTNIKVAKGNIWYTYK